jgi:ABC-2 type transport system permease protein
MFAVLIPVDVAVVPHAARTVALALPIFVSLACLTVGLAWALSTATVFFRDVEHLLSVFFLPWFFLTPVLYGLDQIPNAATHPILIPLLRYCNPVTPYVESIRGVILQGQVPGPGLLLYVFVVGPVAALVGLWIFQRFEDQLAVEL